MHEERLAWLRDRRDEMQRKKEILEATYKAYDSIEVPDQQPPVDGVRSEDPLMSAVHDLVNTTRFHADDDIEAMEARIAILDKVIELVEQGRDEEAKALFQALGDLAEQFTERPEPPTPSSNPTDERS